MCRAPSAARGVLAIAFGILALSDAWISPGDLVCGFAVYAIIGAAAALVAGLRVHSRALILIAFVGAVTGILLLVPGALGNLEFSHAVGAWATLTGILDMFAAGTFHRWPDIEWIQASAGAVPVFVGATLGALTGPGSPAAVGAWLGAMSLLFGALCLAAAARASQRDSGTWNERGPIPRLIRMQHTQQETR